MMNAAVSRGSEIVCSRWSSSRRAKSVASSIPIPRRIAAGKGETATPPINGANPVRNLVPEVVTDAAPTVRPWKPPWKAITLGRPVACRASRRADSTASLPELAKNTESSPAGSEAVESALRLARQATGRPNVIAFHGGFHGRTVGAASVTTSGTKFRTGFAPLMGGVAVSPFPRRDPPRDGYRGSHRLRPARARPPAAHDLGPS